MTNDKGFCPELPKDTTRNYCKTCKEHFQKCLCVRVEGKDFCGHPACIFACYIVEQTEKMIIDAIAGEA